MNKRERKAQQRARRKLDADRSRPNSPWTSRTKNAVAVVALASLILFSILIFLHR